MRAAAPDEAKRLLDSCVAALRELGLPVQAGVFGAHMEVSIVNDGPVTILMDTAEMMKKERKAEK